jgi:hypothetical protein
VSAILRKMSAESASLTDRIRALNLAEAEAPVWNVANNGSGQRRWFVYRRTPGGCMANEYHQNQKGDVIRFLLAGALSRAEALNAAEADKATKAPEKDLRAYLLTLA